MPKKDARKKTMTMPLVGEINTTPADIAKIFFLTLAGLSIIRGVKRAIRHVHGEVSVMNELSEVFNIVLPEEWYRNVVEERKSYIKILDNKTRTWTTRDGTKMMYDIFTDRHFPIMEYPYHLLQANPVYASILSETETLVLNMLALNHRDSVKRLRNKEVVNRAEIATALVVISNKKHKQYMSSKSSRFGYMLEKFTDFNSLRNIEVFIDKVTKSKTLIDTMLVHLLATREDLLGLPTTGVFRGWVFRAE